MHVQDLHVPHPLTEKFDSELPATDVLVNLDAHELHLADSYEHSSLIYEVHKLRLEVKYTRRAIARMNLFEVPHNRYHPQKQCPVFAKTEKPPQSALFWSRKPRPEPC